MASESATLHAYLREISNFPALTPEDERQLGGRIQQHGDEDAVARLVQANLRAVVHYAKRFRHLGVPLLDLIHEGNLGLIEAARRYDPAQSSDFQAAALWWIRQAIMHLFAETGRAAELGAQNGTSGLVHAVAQSRQIEAIRVAIDYALSAAAGREVKEPATSDAEDFAAHLRERGRRRNRRRKTRRVPVLDAGAHLPSTALGARALRAFLN